MKKSEWNELKECLFRDFPDLCWCKNVEMRRKEGEWCGMPEEPEFNADGNVVRFPWEIQDIEGMRIEPIREILGLCACGDPELVIRKFYYPYLQHLNKRRLGEYTVLNEVALNFLVLYVLYDKGLTDHGTSIGGSWLTDKGKTALMLCDAVLGQV